jgi:CTP:molybdopterin cytidylyltransferase MocA
MSVVGAVLAAGGSSRLGRPKQLLSVRGRPLICELVETIRAAEIEHVAVVVGASAAAVVQSVAGRAEILENGRWRTGVASSIHAAVRWACRRQADALLLAACDQPYLSSAHVRHLRCAFERERRCVASGYEDVAGIPAVIAAPRFSELLALRGDRGAARILRSDPNLGVLPFPEGAFDLDTAEDLALYLQAERRSAFAHDTAG